MFLTLNFYMSPYIKKYVHVNVALLEFFSNSEVMLLVSCNQIDIEVIISIKHGRNTIAWKKIIHLGHYPYQQQNIKILSILQGHKNPYGKIFGTRYIIINMKVIIFLKSGKRCII